MILGNQGLILHSEDAPAFGIPVVPGPPVQVTVSIPEPEPEKIKPWQISRAMYEALIMPVNEMDEEEARLIRHIREVRRNWKRGNQISGAIFPARKDVNISASKWQALERKGYVEDRGCGPDITIKAYLHLEVYEGRNPWLGVTYKTHQRIVEEALTAGENVPPEVLAEYPDLRRDDVR